jgi:predicted AAA+ superfamily ATPase
MRLKNPADLSRQYPRFLLPPSKQSFFLFGPRGTGKSTWLSTRFPNALVLDLLDPETFRRFAARPERLKELLKAQPDNIIVIIDEVQKVPQLLPVVHSLIEKNKQYQFILTGSSSRKLKRTGVDLLGGRALLCRMHPFMAAERGEDFSLESTLQLGLVPLIREAPDPKNTLKSYAALYLKEEVQTEGEIRNLGAFARFLEVVSFSHGSVLNISNVARESEISRKVIDGYLQILHDLLLCFYLPVFTKKASRQMSLRPKFYYFDAGVFRSLRPKGPLDRPEEIEGLALEGLVAQHLRAWADYSKDDVSLFFWRTKNGLEVDFVLYGESVFQAIEVKNTSQIRPKDLRGLKEFGKDYPQAKRILLYRGNEHLVIDEITCQPIDDFLINLVPTLEA